MQLIILFVAVTIVIAGKYDNNYKSGKYGGDYKFAWWHTEDNDDQLQRSNQQTSLPQCLQQGSRSKYLDPLELQRLVDNAMYDEEKDSNYEHYENQRKNYDGHMDYDAYEPSDGHGYRQTASAGTKASQNIMRTLDCDLSGTDGASVDNYLGRYKMPGKFCNFDENINCTGKRDFRTITGICNNELHPFYGSSQTAFGRMLPADYDDGVSKPRRKSKVGGLLPPCRKISLAFNTKPKFDRDINNLFVIFGQYIGHDIALATPVSDRYLTPISSCTCDSKYDWNKCNVIDIAPDDPYLSGQKCLAFPATAPAFKDLQCSLGAKEQMNGNTHFVDLSNLYGNTDRTAAVLRSINGTLKSTRKTWAKYEFPPAQKEGKSCVDGTPKRPCVTGGDSRVVENLLFTGIQSMFLRQHNGIARGLSILDPVLTSNQIYEITRAFNIDLFQTIVFGYWVPLLLGPQYGSEYLSAITKSPYDPNVRPVIFNEVSTAALRCHTLVRDLFSRCTPDGKRIDQLWLHDISHKVKLAYDAERNGVDSFLCGALYDYGFAHDSSFAHQIRDRLFETTDNYGHYWRNDLVSINICRGREHGLRNYNSYREKCNFPRAYTFEDFGDTINYEGIQILKRLYKDPEDVDLFVGLNFEDTLQYGHVGPVSACLIAEQFRILAAGDRFFVAHRATLTPDSLVTVAIASLSYLICNTVDIEQIPLLPFSPPNDVTNPLINCTQFQQVNDLAIKTILADLVADPLTLELAIEKTLLSFLETYSKTGFTQRMTTPA